MIIFTSLGGSTIRCVMGNKTMVAFPNGKDPKADIELLGSPQEEPEEGKISWPGEYDKDNIAIRGIGHGEGKRVSYAVEYDNVRCAFLATPLHEWTDYELELLGDVDVLCIPADDAKLAQKLIDQVDPRILIPLPTKDEATFVELLKTVGAQDKGLESEYKVKGSLPAEGREVVILKPVK